MPEGPRTLEGLRVLDFTSMVSGPFCTRLLADCGADVVKVEPPQGDLLRQVPPRIEGRSRYFAAFNAGKKSLTLDLKHGADRTLAARLVGAADVLVENARPGVMERLGLGPAAARGSHPRLVYCSISGFGQQGPLRDWPAYAPIVHALSGFDRSFQGYQPGADRPAVCGIQLADILAGAFAFGAIQTALLRRERTGEGDCIDLSLIESILATLTGDLQAGQAPEPVVLPSYPPLRAKDDFVTLPIISPRAFEALADLIDPTWKSDERFRSIAARSANMGALLEAVERWTLQRSAAECEEVLMSAGVPCARFLSLADVLQSPQLAQRGAFTTFRDAAGAYRVNGAPFRFATAETSMRAGAPELGEHNESVRRDWLGSARAPDDA